MSNYYFQYDTATGVIYPYLQDTAPASSNTTGVLGPYPADTASSQVVMAYTYPERFLAQGNPVTLVEQPYFTVSASNNSGTWTVTATLNNPPATPPTSATITVAGQTETVTLANNIATLTVVVHPSVANAPINVTAGATGCATSRPMNIGGSTQSGVALQVFTPAGGNPTVAPTGTGSKRFLEAFYALGGSTVQRLLGDIGTAINLLSDVNYRKMFAGLRILSNLFEWATKLPTNAYVATAQDTTDIANVQFTADEQNAVNDITANIAGNLFTTLKNAYPNGGTEQLQYKDYVADLATTFKNFEAYMNDLQNIPNLA